MEHAPSEGRATLARLIRQQCNVLLSTVVVTREALSAAGLFDETLRRGHDFDLWLRLALRGVDIEFQPLVLAERRARADGLSGDRCTELERALTVLDKFGRRHDLPDTEAGLLAIRTTELRDALEIERARRRLCDGEFEAARGHLERATALSFKHRVALAALRVAPSVVRWVYCALYPADGQTARAPELPPAWN
jgi:hypothetical protein